MPIVGTWDFENRRIYMAAAVWHPIDLYREYREHRRLVDDSRKFRGLMRMDGNLAKGGGRFTSRFLVMLEGAKIVPVEGDVAPVQRITGEIITDDATAFIDTDPLVVKPFVEYSPPDTEIVTLSDGGGGGSVEVDPLILERITLLWQRAGLDPATLVKASNEEISFGSVKQKLSGPPTNRTIKRIS
jgi:hypothetical protein